MLESLWSFRIQLNCHFLQEGFQDVMSLHPYPFPRPCCCGSATWLCPALCDPMDSLRPHALQHTSPPCPSPSPEIYPSSCPLHWWCHWTSPFSTYYVFIFRHGGRWLHIPGHASWSKVSLLLSPWMWAEETGQRGQLCQRQGGVLGGGQLTFPFLIPSLWNPATMSVFLS